MKKTLSLLLAIALLLTSLFVFSSCNEDKENEEKKEENTYTSDDIAMSSENFSFTRGEVSYIFHKNYSEMKMKYADSVDMYNIDTESSLKGQIYYDDYSWFQYFADMATDYMKELLVFCEAAKADGMEITQEEKDGIDAALKTWTDYARDYDYKIEDLLGKYYNSDVTIDTMRSFMQKETLAMDYQSKLVSEYNFTDEELKQFVSDNADDFYFIDYLKFEIDEDDCDTPKATADSFAAAKTPDEFLALAKDYLENVKKDKNADTTLASCTVTGEKKKEYSDFSKWAFDGVAENSTYIETDEVDGVYTVYMLTKAPRTDDDNSKNIRILMENVSSHNSYQDTINYLNGLIDEWKAGEATEGSFADMVIEKSDDSETAGYGGLISSLCRFGNDNSLPAELISWTFDSARKVGDTGVVKGDGCYYAVYFSGEDIPGWQINANIGLGQNRLNEDFEAKLENHPVTLNTEVINSLEG